MASVRRIYQVILAREPQEDELKRLLGRQAAYVTWVLSTRHAIQKDWGYEAVKKGVQTLFDRNA